jgi:hypothetical protein
MEAQGTGGTPAVPADASGLVALMFTEACPGQDLGKLVAKQGGAPASISAFGLPPRFFGICETSCNFAEKLS